MEEKTQKQSPKIENTNEIKEIPMTTPSSRVSNWIIVSIGSLIAIVGAIYLGLNAGKRLAPVISDKLPRPSIYISQPIPTLEPRPSESMIIAPSSVLSPSPNLTDESEYILDFSSTRTVNIDDLTNLTPWELKVARNEIYARHGRDFVHQDLSCYFNKQAWYQVNTDYSDSKISKLETSNATFILNYEKEIGSPLINKDSGCDQDNP